MLPRLGVELPAALLLASSSSSSDDANANANADDDGADAAGAAAADPAAPQSNNRSLLPWLREVGQSYREVVAARKESRRSPTRRRRWK